MKNSGSMRKIFGENGEQVPLIIGFLLILVVANYVFLSAKIPMWMCHAVTVALIIVAAWCASAGSKYASKQHYEYLQRREEVLFKKIEGINEMLDSLKRHATLSNKQSENSAGSWTDATDKILKEVQASLAGQADVIEEKIAAKVSGDLSGLSEKVEALLSSEPQTGNEWAENVEKNLGDAFRSLEDKVAVQLGESVRKLDEVITAMNDHNTALSSKQSETSEAIKQWMETEKNTSLEEVLSKLDSIATEMKEIAERPSENVSDPQAFEALIADISNKQSETSEVIKQWMETERNDSLEEVLSKLDSIATEMKELAERPSENTSDPQAFEALIADISSKQSEMSETVKQWMETEKSSSLEEVLSKLDNIATEMKEIAERPSENSSDPKMFETLIADRVDPILLNLEEGRKLLENLGTLVQNDEQKTFSLLADVSERLLADLHSAQEEKYQLLKKEFEVLAKKLEDGLQPSDSSASVYASSLVSQTVEMAKTLEEKRQQDAEQFDLIKKQMDVIERVLVGKVMDSTTGSTVESIAKMSAEVNRSIRELQNTGQGAEKMFHTVNLELMAVKEKLEKLSSANAGAENREASAQMNAELAQSLSNILLRLDSIEKKSVMKKADEGMSPETQKANAMLTEKMEHLGGLVSGMQNEISRLLLRVLVSQDDHTERVQKSYDAMLSQVSGMMNDTKKELDLLKNSVEDGTRLLSENDRQSLQTAEEQLVQSTSMKEKIDIYSSVSENYRKDMLMKLDYLQQQMQSLNLLAEVLKDVSMNSKLYNFRSDVR